MRRKHRAVSVGRSARSIARWQRAGLVPRDLDPEMTARALAAMVDHSLYLWLVQGDDPPGTERLLDNPGTPQHQGPRPHARPPDRETPCTRSSPTAFMAAIASGDVETLHSLYAPGA